MTIYTTNYQLALYESNDQPNLRDQYNESMNILDGAIGGIDSKAQIALNIAEQAKEKSDQALAGAQDAGADIQKIKDDATVQDSKINSIKSEMTSLTHDIESQSSRIVKLDRDVDDLEARNNNNKNVLSTVGTFNQYAFDFEQGEGNRMHFAELQILGSFKNVLNVDQMSILASVSSSSPYKVMTLGMAYINRAASTQTIPAVSLEGLDKKWIKVTVNNPYWNTGSVPSLQKNLVIGNYIYTLDNIRIQPYRVAIGKEGDLYLENPDGDSATFTINNTISVAFSFTNATTIFSA